MIAMSRERRHGAPASRRPVPHHPQLGAAARRPSQSILEQARGHKTRHRVVLVARWSSLMATMTAAKEGQMATITSDISAVIDQMTQAAAGFLDGLNDAQREKAAMPFDDAKLRRTWYYTPTPRHGLALRDMTAEQYQWVRKMMASGLSEAGYNYSSLVLTMEWAVDYHANFPDRN